MPSIRTVALEDFDQRIPRTWVPYKVYRALLRAIDGLEMATAGNLARVPVLSIDHIAHTPGLTPRNSGSGRRPATTGHQCRITSASGATSARANGPVGRADIGRGPNGTCATAVPVLRGAEPVDDPQAPRDRPVAQKNSFSAICT